MITGIQLIRILFLRHTEFITTVRSINQWPWRSRRRCADYGAFNHRKHLRVCMFLFPLLANIARLWAKPTKPHWLFIENTVANWRIRSWLFYTYDFSKVLKIKQLFFKLWSTNNKMIIRHVNLWSRRNRRRCADFGAFHHWWHLLIFAFLSC